ncbi:hypothetical protein O9G_000756 [Rozella allomycis CSF55]|uniref:Uncharacterized protein n=1 Tax=Rozella allomycis (strain CSF55) TaxID=988480 RepID=A0A075AYF7_ROZAC|nr:hypothetical protein O9G_000756 [Rozella allomycis CSF55]|eukprot:EPZ35360.1 hypothetical protein O9G_000756 [Rozella allomycis CSF55]
MPENGTSVSIAETPIKKDAQIMGNYTQPELAKRSILTFPKALWQGKVFKEPVTTVLQYGMLGGVSLSTMVWYGMNGFAITGFISTYILWYDRHYSREDWIKRGALSADYEAKYPHLSEMEKNMSAEYDKARED